MGDVFLNLIFMETSILVAKILGIAYISIGLGVLFSPGHYKKLFSDFDKNPTFVYLGGIMALLAGFLIVNFHNIWIKDWVVVITVVGWLALVKGVLLLIAPKVILGMSKPLLKNLKLIGLFALVLGLLVSYLGFSVWVG